MRSCAFTALALLALALLASPPARAEERGDAQTRARALFDEGMAARSVEDLEASICAFESSYALFPHPGTLINLAIDRDRADRALDAYRAWRELMERYSAVISVEARDQATARIEALEARVALIEVRCRPEGATLSVDGGDLGAAPLSEPLALEPGPHRFDARLEGHLPAGALRDLRPGRNPPVELELRRDGPTSAVVSVASATPRARVAVDGGEPRPVPARLEVMPGSRLIALSAPGYVSEEREVELEPGGELRLEVALEELLPPPEPDLSPRRHRTWPWVVGAVVVVGAAAGFAVAFWPEGSADPRWTIEVR